MTTRRRLTPEAGRALEKLGHAIEYLTDEFVHEGRGLDEGRGQVEAIQKLMELNRAVYFECPIVPTLGQRLQLWLNHLAGVALHHHPPSLSGAPSPVGPQRLP